MSTQAELAKLLDDALVVLHKIEGLAVSERNRVEDGVQHARSATASMVVDSPAASASTPDATDDVSAASEGSSGTGAQDAAPQAKAKSKRSA